MLALGFWTGPMITQAGVEVLYATGFEYSEGFDAAYELPQHPGWLGDPYDVSPSAVNSSGVISNTMAPYSQEAFVGRLVPNPSRSFVSVWRPVNHYPTNKPVVHFEVQMTITSSSENRPNEDNFRWSVYNVEGHFLFEVDFDNFYKDVSFFLDDGSTTVTPQTFANDVPFLFSIDMDFQANQWSASIENRPFITGLPITTTGAQLTLGDVDAVWAIYDAGAPGDNSMLFDNYRITAMPVGTDLAWIERLGFVGTAFALRLHGPDECLYAIETSVDLLTWTALKTNMVTAGSFDFIHSPAASSPARFYRARFVP